MNWAGFRGNFQFARYPHNVAILKADCKFFRANSVKSADLASRNGRARKVASRVRWPLKQPGDLVAREIGKWARRLIRHADGASFFRRDHPTNHRRRNPLGMQLFSDHCGVVALGGNQQRPGGEQTQRIKAEMITENLALGHHVDLVFADGDT